MNALGASTQIGPNATTRSGSGTLSDPVPLLACRAPGRESTTRAVSEPLAPGTSADGVTERDQPRTGALRRQWQLRAHPHLKRRLTAAGWPRELGHAAVQQSAAADDRPQSVTEAGPYAGRRPCDSDRRRRPAVPVD